MNRAFAKPPLTVEQQIALLKQRGMTISDDGSSAFYLSQINYYRLVAYWLPFEADHATHQFIEGTTFEAVLDLYDFDRSLRLLVLDAIERFEVAVRTRWAYEMAHAHGPHAYLEGNLFRDNDDWKQNLRDLKAAVTRSDETFVRHYITSYSSPELPPVWAVCEVMSLGLLSRWYKNLGPKQTRKAIASHFGFDQGAFNGVLENLTVVRNICAHHARLWNRTVPAAMPIPKQKPETLVAELNAEHPHRLYNSLVVLLHVMDLISPMHSWRRRVLDLLGKHPNVPKESMGFPAGWLDRPLWQAQD